MPQFPVERLPNPLAEMTMANPERQPLPVAGYTPQTDDKIALVNEFKLDEERILRKIDNLIASNSASIAAGLNDGTAVTGLYDARWANVARTHIQEGFMALNRAVFQPQRIKLPEDDMEKFINETVRGDDQFRWSAVPLRGYHNMIDRDDAPIYQIINHQRRYLMAKDR